MAKGLQKIKENEIENGSGIFPYCIIFFHSKELLVNKMKSPSASFRNWYLDLTSWYRTVLNLSLQEKYEISQNVSTYMF